MITVDADWDKELYLICDRPECQQPGPDGKLNTFEQKLPYPTTVDVIVAAARAHEATHS